jgi:hypothetical protein
VPVVALHLVNVLGVVVGTASAGSENELTPFVTPHMLCVALQNKPSFMSAAF